VLCSIAGPYAQRGAECAHDARPRRFGRRACVGVDKAELMILSSANLLANASEVQPSGTVAHSDKGMGAVSKTVGYPGDADWGSAALRKVGSNGDRDEAVPMDTSNCWRLSARQLEVSVVGTRA
jgi:hypothetical protein